MSYPDPDDPLDEDRKLEWNNGHELDVSNPNPSESYIELARAWTQEHAMGGDEEEDDDEDEEDENEIWSLSTISSSQKAGDLLPQKSTDLLDISHSFHI